MKKRNPLTLNHKDFKAFTDASRLCHVRKSSLIEHSGISNNRFNKYVEHGYLERVTDPRFPDVYRTTPKGRDYFQENTGIHPYASNGIKHDLKLCDIYYGLDDYERDSWMTEREIRDEWDVYSNERACDACYYSEDGDLHFVEVVTRNYSDEEITMHERFAEGRGGHYEQYKA